MEPARLWVVGDDARLEFDLDETKPGRSRIEIWKAGGKQVLVLREQDRTYYDQVAYRTARGGTSVPAVDTLSIRDPFFITSVSKIRVDIVPSQGTATDTAGNPLVCQPTSLRFSYQLNLRLKTADVSMPGLVEGTGEFCFADSLSVAAKLPFGHGLECLSGIPQVDAALVQYLEPLRGNPIKRTLTVIRQIEGGERVSATSTLVLGEFKATDIQLDRFEVPRDYRYQEPQVVAPTRLPR
jgi:hypothetical protein